MTESAAGILAFALAIEARKVFDSFRRAGLSPQPVERTGGEFVLSTPSGSWHSLICGPGHHFSLGLERRLARLDFSPSFALLAGFSGGLTPRAQTGTLWVAGQIKSTLGTWSAPLAPGIANLAEAPLASIWTAHDPVCTALAKQALASGTNSDIVDMESSLFAAIFAKRNIPFGVVRAISDGPGEALPQEVGSWCGPSGALRPAKVAWDLLSKPYIWRSLPKLARGADEAGRALGSALSKIVQSEASWHTTTASRP